MTKIPCGFGELVTKTDLQTAIDNQTLWLTFRLGVMLGGRDQHPRLALKMR